ncbi:hypothetical protein [Actinophytocola gossypii]|uniref:ScoMcrA-like N-terminal head domain-containing protein n=1 Tax=Actinophytocola gossypii TaxID=2812003 RepID=A0ABT2J5Z2_9PSEU|nr:hypothetical protein [Actinophytocola gossypii]MCT2582910.1 hypothetical protein [Actinophytocola gossypii]
MTLDGLERERVLLAAAECDRIGRSAFLRKYRFRKASTYFLELDGALYDTKAIAGRALGLSGDELPDREVVVAEGLRALGFEVRHFPAIVWTRDEIILACAVVADNDWKQPTAKQNDWRIIELSALLQAPEFHPLEGRGPEFRSPASVSRKMADIATRHSTHHGKRTNGNQLDAVVAAEFVARPAEMRAEAERLRARLRGQDTIPAQPPVGTGDVLVRDVPVEMHRVAKFRTRARASEATAVRREAELVARYQSWAQPAEGDFSSKFIFLTGQGHPLRVDLFNLRTEELIEAKGTIDRDDVRLALGQVLDYARYVQPKHLAVLVPAHPGDELVELLLSHGVSCIYETTRGSFERVRSAVV